MGPSLKRNNTMGVSRVIRESKGSNDSIARTSRHLIRFLHFGPMNGGLLNALHSVLRTREDNHNHVCRLLRRNINLLHATRRNLGQRLRLLRLTACLNSIQRRLLSDGNNHRLTSNIIRRKATPIGFPSLSINKQYLLKRPLSLTRNLIGANTRVIRRGRFCLCQFRLF